MSVTIPVLELPCACGGSQFSVCIPQDDVDFCPRCRQRWPYVQCPTCNHSICINPVCMPTLPGGMKWGDKPGDVVITRKGETHGPLIITERNKFTC